MYPVYDAVPGGESSWEKLSSLAADSGEEAASPKDDYAAITAQLAAVGPAAGTRAKSKRPAASVSTCTLHDHMATVQLLHCSVNTDHHKHMADARCTSWFSLYTVLDRHESTT